MKQAKTVSASVHIGLASESQGPESRVDFRPLAMRLKCDLLSEASVISQPPVVSVLVASLNYQYLVTHKIRDTMWLLFCNN